MSARTRNGVLTARDIEIDRWLDRTGGASVDQVGQRFALGKTQAYRRLQVLCDYGLVRRQRILADRPTLYVPARRRVRPATYEHTLALAELVVARELSGALVVSDVELRRELRGQGRLDSRLTDSQLQAIVSCPRLPDAAEVLPSASLLAYEIELSSKGRRRREAAIAAYAGSSYERVAWICPCPRLRALIEGEIEALGTDDWMEVMHDIPT